jgi:hypothetical protein
MGNITVRTWGLRALIELPREITVRVGKDDYSVASAVCRSIGRRLRCEVVALKDEGTACDGGIPTDFHYQATLGRRCRRGGYDVVGSVWFAIPIKSMQEEQ